jgi:hypothetical protein
MFAVCGAGGAWALRAELVRNAEAQLESQRRQEHAALAVARADLVAREVAVVTAEAAVEMAQRRAAAAAKDDEEAATRELLSSMRTADVALAATAADCATANAALQQLLSSKVRAT